MRLSENTSQVHHDVSCTIRMADAVITMYSVADDEWLLNVICSNANFVQCTINASEMAALTWLLNSPTESKYANSVHDDVYDMLLEQAADTIQLLEAAGLNLL